MGGQSAELTLAGGMNLGNLLITAAYYILALVLASRWLISQDIPQDSDLSNRPSQQPRS
jgi:hypothetical protein